MKPASVLIAMQQKESIQQIRQLLQNSGYRVAHSCQSGNEALQAVRSMAPDLLIVNETLPDFQGLDLAEIVIEDRLCAVILLASPAQKAFAEIKMNAAYFACLAKPVQGSVLETTVEMLLRTSRYFQQLEDFPVQDGKNHAGPENHRKEPRVDDGKAGDQRRHRLQRNSEEKHGHRKKHVRNSKSSD